MRFINHRIRLIYVSGNRGRSVKGNRCTQERTMLKTIKMELLIRKAQKKEPEAFTELIRIYMKDMYRTAIAILMNDEDAADAIQDTILACWEKMDTLQHTQYFKTWMTRILIRKCLDIRRKQELVVTMEDYEEPTVEDTYNLELKEALETLGEKYRLIMMLYYAEGYQVQEIADFLEMPVSTVQTRLARGRKKLREYYESE